MQGRIQLPGAVPGHVVTRFPPEPSWLLDVGHVKAALVNDHLATSYQGEWIMRFDDTNPRTCRATYMDAYDQDLELLGLRPARVTAASDYFPGMIHTATQLIERDILYADDTPSEEMRRQRGEGLASPARARPPADSLRLWLEMCEGSPLGCAYCLRFKLPDPAAVNKALRDPVAFRVLLEPHPRTGTAHKVYPTYDFAAPYLDAAEGVTHALRTLEFRDRDELYDWVQQAILAVHPTWHPTVMWEFPRIRFQHTPVTKTQQRALLEAGCVQGVDDPRLPTLRGLMRHGLHPDALKAFLLQQVTPARRETCHTWDKVWALNRQLLEPRSPRHMAVVGRHPVLLHLHGPGTPAQPLAHLQPLKAGHVAHVVRSPDLWLEQQDVQGLAVGDQVLLIAWGVITITAIHTQPLDSNTCQGSAADSSTCEQHDDSTTSRQAVAAQCPSQRQPQEGEEQQQQQEGKERQQIGGSRAQQQEGEGRKGEAGAGTSGEVEVPDVSQARDQQGRSSSTADASCSGVHIPGDTGSSPPPQAAAAPLPAAAAAGAVGPAPPPSCQRVVELEGVLALGASPKEVVAKVHWVPALPGGQLVALQLVSYALPCTTERLTAEDDAVACFDWGSRREEAALGDPSLLLSAAKGTVVQLQRHGLYIVDDVQDGGSCDEGPCPAAGGPRKEEDKERQDQAPTASSSAANEAGEAGVSAPGPDGAIHAAAVPREWPADGAAWPPAGWYVERGGSGSAAAGGAATRLVLIRIPDGHTPWSPSNKKAQGGLSMSELQEPW